MLKQNARSNCENPPTTSCISRLDRERILIANKTNHHPYLLFLYFSCFSHLKRTKHRKHSFVRSANYAPGWQARSPFGSVPPRDLHMRIHVRPRTKFTYSFDTWRSNRVGRGWTTLTRSIGPKKNKDSYKLPYQGFFLRDRIGPVAASNHPQMCLPLVPGLQG